MHIPFELNMRQSESFLQIQNSHQRTKSMLADHDDNYEKMGSVTRKQNLLNEFSMNFLSEFLNLIRSSAPTREEASKHSDCQLEDLFQR